MTEVLESRATRANTGSLLLEVDGLSVGFPSKDGYALAADRVSFGVQRGQALGIVGESGCGKSVSLRALLGVVPSPGRVLGGTARWRDEMDLLHTDGDSLAEVRGRDISMIFQDPQESLDPVYTIGDQLVETLQARASHSRRDARRKALELLDRVEIADAPRRFRDYPHLLSGGMRQRVMIAIAIACDPLLLLADEPTTALDVTIQDQILALISELQTESGMAVVLVSHDLGVIAQSCDQLAVMYAGRIVESGNVDQVLERPRHPYTAALLAAVPKISGTGARAALPISGQPPHITDLPTGCSFRPRCPFASDACRNISMSLDRQPGEHRSACPFVDAADHLEALDNGSR